MDRYNERLIKIKPSALNVIALLMCIVLMLLGAVLVILSPPLGVLIFSGSIALIVISKDYLHQEIEFIITNGDIDVARIIAKKKRKPIGVLEANDITKMDWATSERAKNDIDLGKIKVTEYVGIVPGDHVVALYAGEGDKQKIYVMDLDEKCVEHLKQVLKVKSEIK